MDKKLTPDDVLRLASEKKAISVPSLNIDKMPAAFLQNMPFRIVMERFLKAGAYEYISKKKKR